MWKQLIRDELWDFKKSYSLCKSQCHIRGENHVLLLIHVNYIKIGLTAQASLE